MRNALRTFVIEGVACQLPYQGEDMGSPVWPDQASLSDSKDSGFRVS